MPIEIDIATQDMQRVNAADRQPVAVARDDPDVEVRVRQLEPRREGRRAAVDGVEAAGRHVVGEPGGAADARDEHRLVRRRADPGERRAYRLDRSEEMRVGKEWGGQGRYWWGRDA